MRNAESFLAGHMKETQLFVISQYGSIFDFSLMNLHCASKSMKRTQIRQMYLALHSTCNQMWALVNHMWEWKQSQGPFSENHLRLDHMVSTLESGSKGIPAFCNLQADRVGDTLRDTVNYPGRAEPGLEAENGTFLCWRESEHLLT